MTAELVARVARTEPDPGPQPGSMPITDEDYERIVDELVAERPPGPLWLFVYGSLIWKPEIEHDEERLATAPGWHRAFCLKLTRWRGTRERPGLMMALDRGGSCNGLLLRIPERDVRSQLDKLMRRETSVKWITPGAPVSPPIRLGFGSSNVARWIKVRSSGEVVPALAFVANPKGHVYAGKLPLEEVARILAIAAGHWGSCAEYLHNTVVHLESRGIRDRGLWRLQALVAAEIEKAYAPEPGP